jgi:predicted component of type VI protein secretion system
MITLPELAQQLSGLNEIPKRDSWPQGVLPSDNALTAIEQQQHRQGGHDEKYQFVVPPPVTRSEAPTDVTQQENVQPPSLEKKIPSKRDAPNTEPPLQEAAVVSQPEVLVVGNQENDDQSNHTQTKKVAPRAKQGETKKKPARRAAKNKPSTVVVARKSRRLAGKTVEQGGLAY